MTFSLYFTRYCSSLWRSCSTRSIKEIRDWRSWLNKSLCTRTEKIQSISKHWYFWYWEAERAVCMLHRRSVGLWRYRKLMSARKAHSSWWAGWLFKHCFCCKCCAVVPNKHLLSPGYNNWKRAIYCWWSFVSTKYFGVGRLWYCSPASYQCLKCFIRIPSAAPWKHHVMWCNCFDDWLVITFLCLIFSFLDLLFCFLQPFLYMANASYLLLNVSWTQEMEHCTIHVEILPYAWTSCVYALVCKCVTYPLLVWYLVFHVAMCSCLRSCFFR